MKTVKELMESTTQPSKTYLAKFDKRVPQQYPNQNQVPSVLMLKRKAIRVFPDNQKIALYYSEALDKYVSIPFGPEGKALGIHLSEEAPNFDSAESLDEALPLIPLALGAARMAAPHLLRGGKAIIQGLAKGGSAAANAARKGGSAASNLARKGRTRFTRKRGSVLDKNQKLKGVGGRKGSLARNARNFGAGAVLGQNLSDRGGNPDGSSVLQGHQFNDNLAKAMISAPNVGVERANNNYRQRQNQSQIWQTTSAPRSVSESTIESFKAIVESDTVSSVVFGDQSVAITPRIAKKLVGVYESLNKQNKKNFEALIGESIESLRKAINFCIKA